ncbi:hypothetical protein pqer_cds_657 [Pandoravirus quercus]|uniref:Uncharacterized protein n=1 Tax=Pandoravirus quercus TaxID=2107709 RepID=A0A2U7U9H1_9VIRU|nr:hypothetical protein pqer_cds_657 [Pandoravirus quercus]AVK75079.1 hypothetical protein pqer_cds_657 [Pandoravirus quercus]
MAETFKEQSIHMFIITHYPHCSSFPLIKTYTIYMAQSKTKTKRSGGHWYGAVDGIEPWKDFEQARQSHDDSDSLMVAMFCAANRDTDPRGPGPIAGLMSSLCNDDPDKSLDHAMHRASTACRYQRPYSHEDDTPKHVPCIRKAANFLDYRVSRPIIPANYAETVATRCGIELRDGAEAASFVKEVNRARLCVLGERMAHDTPLRRAIRLDCKGHTADERFSTVYDAARSNGASLSSAVSAANTVAEPIPLPQ